jgi:hypothetical protein
VRTRSACCSLASVGFVALLVNLPGIWSGYCDSDCRRTSRLLILITTASGLGVWCRVGERTQRSPLDVAPDAFDAALDGLIINTHSAMPPARADRPCSSGPGSGSAASCPKPPLRHNETAEQIDQGEFSRID